MTATQVNETFLDLELQAEIRLRAQRVPLEVLAGLRAGDLLELEHHPDDPVELVVNGATVARGELMVIDGQFAIRITQNADDIAAGAPAIAPKRKDGDDAANAEEPSDASTDGPDAAAAAAEPAATEGADDAAGDEPAETAESTDATEETPDDASTD